MSPNEYQLLAHTTSGQIAKYNILVMGALGLNGEAGEVADIIKKWVFHKHKLATLKLAEELGDVLWYIAELCTGIDITLEAIMEMNIDKLKQRYPEGFSSKKSINRVESKEKE